MGDFDEIFLKKVTHKKVPFEDVVEVLNIFSFEHEFRDDNEPSNRNFNFFNKRNLSKNEGTPIFYTRIAD